MRYLLRSKIHKAIVTEANLDYVGSITIDEDLMRKVDLWSGEKVLVVDNTNGARLETYVIPGQAGSGIICMNGAAAHLIKTGDEIIIMGFELTNEPIEAKNILVDRNNKFLRYLSMAMPQRWEICTKFLWDDSYIASLDKFLKFNKVKAILDCAGGTGFPSLELKKIGWDISYTDGSPLMYRYFQKKLKRLSYQMPNHLTNWLDMDKKIQKKFDVVLCRGNSLIYVDSWDNNIIGSETKEHIKRSLKIFYNLLNPGGLLYIDLTHRKEFNQLHYPIIEEFGEKIIDGNKIKLRWELDHDYQKKIRIWKSVIWVNEQRFESSSQSYLLEHKELISLLKEVGFSQVKEARIDGENVYNIFVAFK